MYLSILKQKSMKTNFLLTVFMLVMLGFASLQAQLIVYEGFNYTLASTAADPDGGTVNGGNGFPYTNSITPANVGVGLRGAYGTMHTVVTGLTYGNNGKMLATSANALQRTSGSSYGSDVWIYRSVDPDPFADYRASANWLGYKSGRSNELYFSVLLNVSSVNTSTMNRLVLWYGINNVQYAAFLAQPSGNTNWVYADQAGVNKVLGAAEANKTEFIVGKLSFPSLTSYSISLWFNPTLGAALGDPTITQGYPIDGANWTTGPEFRGLTTRDGAGIFTFDEFRLGLTAADVMPVSPWASNNPQSEIRTQVLKTDNNTFAVQLKNKQDCESIEVFNTAGMRVMQLVNVSEYNTVTLPNSGVYVFVVNFKDKKEVTKVIN